MEGPSISLCAVVHNEAATLDRIIRSFRPYVARVVVVDGSSTDGTGDIARRLADVVRVVAYSGSSDAGGHKQWCIDNAGTEWVVFCDGDEMFEPALMEALGPLAASGSGDAFEFRRVTFVDGVLFDLFDDFQVRLVRRGVRWPDGIHGRPIAENIVRWDGPRIIHTCTLERMEANTARYIRMFGEPPWDRGFNARNLTYARRIVMLKDVIAETGRAPKEVVDAYERLVQQVVAAPNRGGRPGPWPEERRFYERYVRARLRAALGLTGAAPAGRRPRA